MVKFRIVKQSFVLEKHMESRGCHASSLIVDKNDEVKIVFFKGRNESDPSVNIFQHNLNEDSTFEIMNSKEPMWNPVIFQAECREIVFAKKGKNPHCWRTFSNSVVPETENEDYGPVKNKPIILSNGDWIAGASTETFTKWRSYVDISKDKGLSWKRIGIPMPGYYSGQYKGLIQPSLYQYDEVVYAFLRSDDGMLYRAKGYDYGTIWEDSRQVNFPNNNSGIDVVDLKDDRMVAMVANPVFSPEINSRRRTPLGVFYSTNCGYDWKTGLTLEDGQGEFSYPAVVRKDNFLHISYTWNRVNIKYVKVEIHG